MREFSFEDAGRTFTCTKGPAASAPGTDWWWFSVQGDSNRYAAFHSAKGDSPATVGPRIVQYYDKMLADRARPSEFRTQWQARRAASQAAAQNASAAAADATPAAEQTP